MNTMLEHLSVQLRRYGTGQALLFTGAAFSAGATNINNENVPLGSDLIRIFQTETRETTDDLGLLARVYIHMFGEHKLYQLITTAFRTKTVAPQHTCISSFPWKAVYTTNYDDVFEFAATQSSVITRSYNQTQHPRSIDSTSLPVVHLNGYVHDITITDFLEKIRLTNVSYVSDDISKSLWGAKFRSDILASPCLIFIGYSMSDLDIARIIFSFPEMKDRIYFVTSSSLPMSTKLKLNDFGIILDIGTVEFARFLAAVLQEGIDRKEVFFTNIERFRRFEETIASPKDSDVRNLLVLGDLRQDLLASELAKGTENYTFHRDCITTILELVPKSTQLNVLLVSNIGNGKSVCADIIGHRLAAKGAEVFRIRNNTKRMFEELAKVKLLPGKKVFIIDNLFSHFDTVRVIQSMNLPDYLIISCTRTTLYDLRGGEARNLLASNLYEFNLDVLSRKEIDSVIQFFNQYGYWRELQCYGDSQKANFMSYKCSSELRTLLLHFLDTQPIKRAISTLFGPEACNARSGSVSNVRRLVTCAQMINLAGYQPTFGILGDILDFDCYRAAVSVDSEYREFLKIRQGKLALQSPILSEYIIKKILDGDFLVETMIEILTQLDILGDSDDIYNDLSKTFVRYGFLESFLPQHNKRDLLIKFYENVKILKHMNREPLFWLQYAIARLSLKEFGEAKQLFDVAYSFSRARGYTENRHLDNQYARYLIESRTYSEEYNDFMDAFIKADRILNHQMNAEPLSYNPYRVAINYYEFVIRRRDVLAGPDKLKIVRSCVNILKHIDGGSKRLTSYPAVIECGSVLKATLKVLNV